jgi:hypothetical protein
MPCHAMHPIQDLFLEGFSYVLQIDMHFICTPMLARFYFFVKSGCYNFRDINFKDLERQLAGIEGKCP